MIFKDNSTGGQVLDDLKMIHQQDGQDALGIVEKQYRQLKYVYEAKPVDSLNGPPIHNLVVAGMGGSALAASILSSWPGVLVPFQVVRDYSVPSYVGKNTLFIASSYSGNTEETLSALEDAEAKGARIVIICADGKLAKIAAAKNYPFYQIPDGLQPRMAVFYNLAALIQLLEPLNLIAQGSTSELSEAADWLEAQGKSLLPSVATKDNKAKQLALELVGNSVVIYSGPKLFPVAYKWKININENAKSIAWCNYLPEFNHNEFLGWTSHPIEKPYKVVDIRSSLEHPRTQKRFVITEKLLSGKRPHPEVIIPEGDSLLKQLLWTIQLGDFVSIYLALLNGLNPIPVKLIEKLKDELRD